MIPNTSTLKGYRVIGKNKDTLTFSVGNTTFIKFKATELIDKLNSYNEEDIYLNICGRASVNYWRDTAKPQILIDEIEILNETLYKF